MRFEWDPAKALSNLAKHGVTFEQAMSAFDDPEGWETDDVRHSTAQETRKWLIGWGDIGLLVVVFAELGEDSRRIISARRAGRRDGRRYES